MTELTRSKRELLAENVLRRQQLIVARRHIKRPKLTRWDRLRLLLCGSCGKYWRDTTLLEQWGIKARLRGAQRP